MYILNNKAETENKNKQKTNNPPQKDTYLSNFSTKS